MLICFKFDFRCKSTTFFRYMQIFFLFFSCVCHYFVVPLQRIFIHYLQKLQILINSFVL